MEKRVTNSPTVLFVDDDAALRQLISRYLTGQGFEVTVCGSVAEALGRFYSLRPDVVVLDLELGDGTAMDLLAPWHAAQPDTPILILTGHADISNAVATIKAGAEQFLTKPVELAVLAEMLCRLVDRGRERRLVEAAGQRREFDPFVGSSAAVRTLAHQAAIVASGTAPVLVTGETGSGKGVLARWIHRNGPRANQACVDLNCAGLSRELLESELFGHTRGAFTGAVSDKKGLLEVADRGTLFLDEIGELDVSIQPKLLKALEEQVFRRLGDVRERQVSFRLIAATNRDLRNCVESGTFREDLYYRVSALPLRIPALRDRPGDLADLAQAILLDLERERGVVATLSDAALRCAMEYRWPGNIRELRNVLERAVLFCGGERVIRPEHLFLDSTQTAQTAGAAFAPATLDEVVRRHIVGTLELEQGDVGRAATRLDMPRSTLYQRLTQLGLSPADFR